MTNKYFPKEEITKNDLYFICYMVERIARKLKQRNAYVVNAIGLDEWQHLLSVANVLHAENPLAVEDAWIADYKLQSGDFDIFAVDSSLVDKMPTPIQMGKVYQRLISDTLQPGEDYAEALYRIYNNSICEVIDNYNCSAFYEPSYIIAKAYYAGGF